MDSRPADPRLTDRRWILPATILGSSLSFIDGSVVNVALPAIRVDFGTTLATLQWVVNGYMLTLASFILLGGSAGDRFGRRRVFLLGLSGFIVASVACGLAPGAGWLIGARMVQGIAAALLMPASLAIISSAYTGEARGAAIGTWAAAAAITSALGPPLGGWLVDAIGWRAIFFINVPVGGLALVFGSKLGADARVARADPLDVRGGLLAILALGSLSYGLVALGQGKYPSGTVALALSLPLAWWFLRSQARVPAPMMPLDLFGNRTFTGANVVTVLLYAALSAALFLLPLMLIGVHRYSAAAAGASFLPMSAIMGAGSRWSGRLVTRIGARSQLILGQAIVAGAYVILAFSGDRSSYWTGFLPGLVGLACGMTLCVTPLTATVFDSSPADRSGTASGVNNAAARAGGLVAIAAIGLAFGSAGMANAGRSSVIEAYRSVMIAAAVLASSGALTAAFTIDTNEGR